MNMKNIAILTFIILAVGFPAASFASFDQDLWYGSKGDNVKELQDFLSTEGCFNYSEFTGNFFSVTVNAVKCFQSKYGITPVAGYFGPKTRIKANEILAKNLQAGNQEAASNSNTQVATGTANATTATTAKNGSIKALQDQLDALLAQLQELNDQVKAQTTVQQLRQFRYILSLLRFRHQPLRQRLPQLRLQPLRPRLPRLHRPHPTPSRPASL
jgi:peptidoglycan hydrolase-like protein with peptidoglycan-binding domain